MVVFLVGLVWMILVRTLRKDYARYQKEESIDELVCLCSEFLVYITYVFKVLITFMILCFISLLRWLFSGCGFGWRIWLETSSRRRIPSSIDASSFLFMHWRRLPRFYCSNDHCCSCYCRRVLYWVGFALLLFKKKPYTKVKRKFLYLYSYKL